MKIVCDSCSTKYSISDEKVRGKVFKIRCKKCSHIIVVRGTGDSAAGASDGAAESSWHIVVEGEQVGPLSDAEVRARLSRGELTGDNYVWREGFSDWLRLAAVPEFADAIPASDAGGDGFGEHDALPGSVDVPTPDVGSGAAYYAAVGGPGGGSGSGNVGGRGRGGVTVSGTVGSSPEGADSSAPYGASFGASPSPANGSFGGADLFGSAVPAAQVDSGRVRSGANGTASGRHDGGRIENLTAQRSENSVLFSLSNLQSLALGSAAPKPTAPTPTAAAPASEGSGLIDIRAMAASTLRVPGGDSAMGGVSGGGDDLPAFGSLAAAPPVLLPIPSASGPPKWIYPLIAAALLLFIAVGAAAYSILRKPVVVEQPAPPPAAPVASNATKRPSGAAAPGEQAAANAPGAPAGKEGASGATAAPGETREGTAPAAGAAKPEKVERTERKGGRRTKRGGGDVKAGGGAVATGSAPAVEEKKPVKGSLDDLLEGALNRRGGAPAKEEPAAAKKTAPEPAGAGPLSKSAVVAGMNGVKGKVSDCYGQYKVPGTAMVNVVIGKSGKVSSATVTGKFAGTPTGACVEKAVKTASFPPSDGLTTPYPFTLR